jgi:hypothetical protein
VYLWGNCVQNVCAPLDRNNCHVHLHLCITNASGVAQAVAVAALIEQRLQTTCKIEPDGMFDLRAKTGAWCMQELGMLSGDIITLRHHLGIPRQFRTVNSDSASGLDALCMLLYRMSWTRKCSQLRETFGGSGKRIERISNALCMYLYNWFKRKLESLDRSRLTDDYLVSMARAQFRKNGDTV